MFLFTVRQNNCDKTDVIKVEGTYANITQTSMSFFFSGVVGPELSTEARVLSPILGSVAPEDRLLQLGFSSSAADLGNQKLYPNFLRVIPSDSVQTEVGEDTLTIASA
ncbi:hypothetical protein DPMN_010593 [Dreissena polymorpha]|uniref:Uncharacterized protein n=1 Tax=Dreissena polymorpha TaxID=45954 RepID=A0A9D4MZ13_DREPO|nr:hypothetical protein DPMN_010593 [Dreissena polymorpha]